MSPSANNWPTLLVKTIIACAPWIVSMYTLYWLEYSGTWSLDTPHRGKASVIILATGMGLSFLAYSRLFARRQQRKPNSD